MVGDDSQLGHLGFSFGSSRFSFFLPIFLELAWELHGVILREGWMFGQQARTCLDLLWCIEDSAVFPISISFDSRFSIYVIFGAFSLEIRGRDLKGLSLQISWGIHTWVPRYSFLGDLPSQIRGNILQFGGFWMNSWRGVLEVWLSITLDLVSFGAWSSSQRLPMRYS